MISISHPEFREELFFEAQKISLLGPERTLSESFHGIYPVQLEETVEIYDQIIKFRPVKTVDERKIQEHFYNLEKEDAVPRFFLENTTFIHDDIDVTFGIDDITNLTIVAIIGEVEFGKVIGLGEYLLNKSTNMEEVAFTVSREWQGKGISKIILLKLAEATS